LVLKGYKRDFDFYNTKRMQQDFALETFYYSYKGIDADYHGKPDDINKDGKVDDADKTALLPMNLIEVHKIGLQVHTLYFRNETTAYSSDYNNDRF
jgi:glycerophosphoryl diester phosphodiesterase